MSQDNKTIWIINHYASHLETRHLELAKVFAKKGYKTVIITSSFHHGKHYYLFKDEMKIVERAPNVFFSYIHSNPAYYSNGGKRVINMLDFCKKIKKYKRGLEQVAGIPLFIIGSSAHPFVWEVAYTLSKHYNAKFIAEFRDIWPLSLIEIQGVSPKHPFVRLLSIIEKRAYKNSDAIVSTMPYAYLHVCDDLGFPKDKLYWMPNGINTATYDEITKSEASLPHELEKYLDDHWCCVYVGSIVKSECLDYLLNSWKLVKSDNLFFAIVGDGAEKNRIQDRIKSENIKNVKMFPPVHSEEVPLVLDKANCCIAALEFGNLGKFGLSKYKLNDYLYSGKPTILSSDYPSVVDVAGHFSLPIGREQLVADTIVDVSKLDQSELDRLTIQGKRVIKDNYDIRVIADRYIKLLESL